MVGKVNILRGDCKLEKNVSLKLKKNHMPDVIFIFAHGLQIRAICCEGTSARSGCCIKKT
jgi:hypothetical protein